MNNQATKKLTELISQELENKNYELVHKLTDIYHDLTTSDMNESKRKYREHRKQMIKLYGNKSFDKETLTIVDLGKMTQKEYELKHDEKMTDKSLTDIDFYFSSGNGYYELKLLEDSIRAEE